MISRNFNQRITQGKKILWRSSSLWGNKKQKGTTQIIASPLKSTVVNDEIKFSTNLKKKKNYNNQYIKTVQSVNI